MPADGSAPSTPFITSPKGDDTPRYLPDGGVAFLSSRDGATQVYVADGSGANVRAVTHQAAGAQGPLVVSLNGRMVAYVVDLEAMAARARAAARRLRGRSLVP